METGVAVGYISLDESSCELNMRIIKMKSCHERLIESGRVEFRG